MNVADQIVGSEFNPTGLLNKAHIIFKTTSNIFATSFAEQQIEKKRESVNEIITSIDMNYRMLIYQLT